MSSNPCNYVHGLRGEGLAWLLGHSMPAGSICGSRVHYAGYGCCLTCAAGYYSQCRSDTTSTVVKRRWHVLRMLSGAIPSTWLYLYLLSLRWLVTTMITMPLKFFIGSLCQMIPALRWQRNLPPTMQWLCRNPLSPRTREQRPSNWWAHLLASRRRPAGEGK